jgi:hypothetical protein
MTIERRNPLPAGRYWIDIFESGFTAFQSWLSNNKSSVRVETTEDYPAAGDAPARQFYIFAVSAPTAWPSDRGLGLPSIATSNVTSSSDTATRPDPPPDVVDQIAATASGIGEDLKKTVLVVVGAGLFIAIAVGLSRTIGKRRR